MTHSPDSFCSPPPPPPIHTHTQVPETVNDAYFVAEKSAKSTDKEGEFFGEKKGGKGLSAERKEEQKVRSFAPSFHARGPSHPLCTHVDSCPGCSLAPPQ